MTALLIGFLLVAVMGIGHHSALLGINGIVGSGKSRPNLSVTGTFIGLLVLHVVEILYFAGAYWFLLSWEWTGSLSSQNAETWSDLVYFSGINYATLGYTQIETVGPIRMINMMRSLGGFMALTWSATFIYSIWNKAMQ